jgi:flagellar hook-associated protein FlgK
MAASEVDDNELPDEIISSLEDFYRSINTVEETLDPLLAMSSEEIHEKVRQTMKTLFEMLRGV